MLARLESKLAALVAEHTGLPVGIGALDPPGQGSRALGVAVAGFAPETGFAPYDTAFIEVGGSPRSRRVVPLGFEAVIDLRSRPAAATAPARDAARAALLEDMSSVAFLLGDPDLQTGRSFAGAEEDDGFRVLSFRLAAATAAPGLVEDDFAGRVQARGQALIWPVGTSREEGVIAAIDRVLAPLPVPVLIKDRGLRPGQTTTVTLELGTLERMNGATDLAVTVVGDVPPASRGTLPDAPADAETGVALVRVETPRVAIRYRAPDQGPSGAGRTEYLAIHLATPDGKAGVHLGSAAIRLLAAP